MITREEIALVTERIRRRRDAGEWIEGGDSLAHQIGNAYASLADQRDRAIELLRALAEAPHGPVLDDAHAFLAEVDK